MLEYTSMESAREEAGFELMKTYIRRRRNTAQKYIATQKIMDLYKAVERKQGGRESIQWHEQAKLDLEGLRHMAVAEVETNEYGLE